MAKKDFEKQIENAIERLMKTGNYSYAEAREIAIDDWKIDHGERLDWEPSIEEEKAMRKATKIVGERKKSADGAKKKVVRKEDPDKRLLISLLAQALEQDRIKNLNITNVERMISFEMGGEFYEVMLTRKNKNLMKKKAND